VHTLNPSLELFGLDISAAMIGLAQKNLTGIKADLQQGNIRRTGYPDDYFDIVTCTGSFYLWDYPEEGLREIHRILKRGRSAHLYECRHEYDRQALQRALRDNLRHLNMISRIIGPLALTKALRMAYRRDEVTNIVSRTGFAGNFELHEMTFSGLPVWIRIDLRKNS
jgi:ubiquinone/menaquinone biosynthesis C-methylase UbiE